MLSIPRTLNGYQALLVMSTCTVCGGSGIQRVSSQRFRTCLTCLGTGQIGSTVHSAPVSQRIPLAAKSPDRSCVVLPAA